MFDLIFWGVLFVVFVLGETSTTQLISIWFAAGALISFITALFVPGFMIQLGVFVAGSILLLLVTRPLLKKFVTPRHIKTNAADTLVGKKCVVLEEVDNLKNTGRVKEQGLTWNARSVDKDQVIAAGAVVEVVSLQGVTAYVKEII